MLIVSGFRLRSAVQSAMSHLCEAIDFATLHPTRALRRQAVAESVAFIQEHMPQALSFYTARQVLRHCLGEMRLGGMILEFGVFKGGTINFIAGLHPEREIHGFDSFEGLPTAWAGTGHEKGAFFAGGRLPRVAKNVTLHKGFFDASLPGWAERHAGPIAFLHVDCDLCSSTRTVFDILRDRIVPGTIIVFDEYFGYPGWQRGEHLAFQEYLHDSGVTFEYLCHAFYQVGVRILDRR